MSETIPLKSSPREADGSDPALVHAWVRGWALSRGLAAPTAAYGGWRVEVGLADQRARFVFPALSPGVAAAVAAIREPFVFLKVCAAPDAVQTVLASGWALRPLSYMMDHPALPTSVQAAPDGYRLIATRSGERTLVQALTLDGGVAANGAVVLVDGNAIFDRIETHPDHRRRGLGRAVMGRLSDLAVARRCARGLLVATPDGRALYETLGWRVHSPYCSAVREGAPQDGRPVDT